MCQNKKKSPFKELSFFILLESTIFFASVIQKGNPSLVLLISLSKSKKIMKANLNQTQPREATWGWFCWETPATRCPLISPSGLSGSQLENFWHSINDWLPVAGCWRPLWGEGCRQYDASLSELESRPRVHRYLSDSQKVFWQILRECFQIQGLL